MRAFELLAVVYFVAIAVASRSSRAEAAPKRRVMRFAILAAGAVVVASYLLPWSARAWLPLVWLVLGYWIPAWLAPALPDRAFEAWLVKTDADWRVASIRPPGWIRHALELAYLACYVLVPAAFAAVWALGAERDVERYWLAVLLSGYACYGTVPWLVARPPRALEPAGSRPRGVAAFNTGLLARVSHEKTTFPSGHVAVAIAAALTVWPVSAAAGLGVALIAAGIAAGAVVGRYHFAVDVVLGAVVGLAAALASV